MARAGLKIEGTEISPSYELLRYVVKCPDAA